MTRVVVAAPWCTPGREQVLTALRPYGYRMGAFSVRDELIKGVGGTPLYFRVSVDFTPQAAKWGEYMLIRWGFKLLSRPLEPRNLVWGDPARHGRVPPPWNMREGDSWHQSNCKKPDTYVQPPPQPTRNGWAKRLRKALK